MDRYKHEKLVTAAEQVQDEARALRALLGFDPNRVDVLERAELLAAASVLAVRAAQIASHLAAEMPGELARNEAAWKREADAQYEEGHAAGREVRRHAS